MSHLPVMLIRDRVEPRVRAIHSFSFTVAQMDKVSQTNELLAIWAASVGEMFTDIQ
ncbi:hypothetical protein CY34DRAFT_810327 [Suillus luteus UH-Slu-Lm8-n1]|uniref:Uncharacterized protein n=1 Tax=Suillus luteus UH-Slu-Lm8-n1 TaxID=930992 RepID=A0A0D0AT83_9AGAM|nr:hypothetical protein CY34DRAFT_810327 [Suillus luteus UH-Slu-Lm8-n1]